MIHSVTFRINSEPFTTAAWNLMALKRQMLERFICYQVWHVLAGQKGVDEDNLSYSPFLLSMSGTAQHTLYGSGLLRAARHKIIKSNKCHAVLPEGV